MIRSLVAVFCVICVATVLSEGLGLVILWWRGQLSADNLREIRLVLSGETGSESNAVEAPETPHPSAEEVVRARALAILDFETRERELNVLKGAAIANEDRLIAEKMRFEQTQRAFEERLAKLLEETRSEATEQTRAVLQALPASGAADNLMQLPLDEAAIVLRGMPEKTIARILSEFQNGPPPRQQRGKELFEAIARGEPNRSEIEAALRRDDDSMRSATASSDPAAMR